MMKMNKSYLEGKKMASLQINYSGIEEKKCSGDQIPTYQKQSRLPCALMVKYSAPLRTLMNDLNNFMSIIGFMQGVRNYT